MKKTLAVITALVLVFTMLSGCGKKNDAGKKPGKKKPTQSSQSSQTSSTDDIVSNTDSSDSSDDYTSDDDYVIDSEIEDEVKKLKLNTSSSHYTESMYISVKNFGAKGDGKTDDTKAIQSAINSSTGFTVYFPAGTYIVTSPIQISPDTNLLGEAAASGVGGSTVLKAGADMDAIFSGESFTSMRMTIGNFTFDGSSKAGKRVNWGINMTDCRSSSVFNCRFYDISGGGINLDENGNGSLWVNRFNYLDFDNINDYAIRAIVSDSFFSHITVNGGKGILDFNYSGNCYSNILVKNGSGSGLTLGRPQVSELGNITVRNCSFINNAEYGISLVSPDLGKRAKQATVSNCYMSGNGAGDIGTANSCAIIVDNCYLGSGTAINASGSNSLTLTGNTVKAASFLNAADSTIYSNGNKFGAAANTDGYGYLADGDTLFKEYENTFKILGARFKGQYVNVEECGEPDGDDWSRVFEIAVAKVSKTGGVIYCPSGSYGIGETIVVPSNVYIVGNGKVDSNQFFPVGTVDCMFVVRKAKNVGFINFNLTNSSASNKATYGGIYFMNSSDCYFYNCALSTGTTSSMPYAVNIDTESSRIMMDNCKLGAAASGYAVVLCRGTDCVFQNLYATAGPSFILMNGKNNVLQSNHFETCNGTHITIKGDSAIGHSIRSNYFDVNVCCVRMSFTASYNSGISVRLNTFRTDARVQDATTGRTPPELILSNASGVSIFGNTFQQGFSIITTGIACSNSVFEGNVVTNTENTLFSQNTKALGNGCRVAGNNNSK